MITAIKVGKCDLNKNGEPVSMVSVQVTHDKTHSGDTYLGVSGGFTVRRDDILEIIEVLNKALDDELQSCEIVRYIE